MIKFLHHNLNEFDVNALKQLMINTKYPFYEIIDIKESDIDYNNLKDSDVILVYDETKNKSVFDKRMDVLFPDEDWVGDFPLRIDKPSTFMKDPSEIEKVWNIVASKCKIFNNELDISLLPKNINSAFHKIINNNNYDSVITIKDDHSKLEIRPKNVKPTMKNSITYDELIVMMAAKYTFNFNKLDIKSDD